MPRRRAEEDEHYPYADAVACALASVLLLFVAAVVNQGAGGEDVPAYGTLTVEIDPTDRGGPPPLAAIDLGGEALIGIGAAGKLAAGPKFDAAASPPSLRPEAAARLETPEDAAPAVSVYLPPWPPLAPRGAWKVDVTVRDSRRFGVLAFRLGFPAGNPPRSVDVRYFDNQAGGHLSTLHRRITGPSSGPFALEVRAGGDELDVARGVTP